MTPSTRFAIASAIAAALSVGGGAMLFGLPWLQVTAFTIFAALLGALCVVLLAHARRRPHAEATSSADDAPINAMIASDIVSSGGDDSGHGGHHGM